MNTKLTTGILALAMTSGCVVYSDDHHHADTVIVERTNYTPEFLYAEAGCYWSDYHHDFIWYFDAEVFDDDIVTGVYADVFDAYGVWVDSFELYNETVYEEVWFSDWLQYSTYLDCYYGGYQIDLVAYDSYDAYDIVSIAPYTY